MSKWATEWSGRYPNLCSGKWSLYRDDVLLDVDIPFNGESQFDSKPAYTSGCWHSVGIYHEGDEWVEFDDEYRNGRERCEWCDEHRSWLQGIAPEQEWGDIYLAFAANDWRYGSCGGCI